MIIYVHEPSLMTILSPGKTIKSSFPYFTESLRSLLIRCEFPQSFMLRELAKMDAYSLFKTQSKPMLGHLNQLVYLVGYHCRDAGSFDSIDKEKIENICLEYLFSGILTGKEYTTSLRWWAGQLGNPLHDPGSRFYQGL